MLGRKAVPSIHEFAHALQLLGVKRNAALPRRLHDHGGVALLAGRLRSFEA